MAAQDRLHALDAVRAFALLAGIVLHATMSFFLPIPALDSSQSGTLAVTFYAIHMFRMSAFFLIAGFFARMVVERRGVRAFVKDRSKRIVVPMIVGWLVFGTLAIAVTVWSLTRSFEGQALPEGMTESMLPGFPLTHLWFLYYLCIFYALALLARAAFVGWLDASGRIRAVVDRTWRAVVTTYTAPAALALPAFAVLYFSAAWQPWGGIPTPDFGFTPKVPATVAFGTAFAAGWLLHRQTDLLGRFKSAWHVHLALAVGLTIACLSIVDPVPSFTSAPARLVEGSWQRIAYTACYTLGIWCWTFGIIGAGLRFCSTESPLRRYLADSSYWLYLAHLPLVFFLQAVLAKVPLHWTVKFPLILAIALAVLLVSYHYLVRPTVIGELLNGRRYPRAKAASGIARAPEPPPRGGRGAADLTDVTKRYGDTAALDRVSLEVGRGDLVAVLGPNGAGKSTAISLWLGTLEPDAGEVRVLGSSAHDIETRRAVGIMLQDVNLAAELCARELIALTSSYYRNPLGIEETVALTGISAFANKRYAKLSGGQKRQVQFALAICGRPQLLFLDEPTVGLDVSARETMWRTIRSFLAAGASIVLTTHYLEEAEALANRVVVLAKGRVIAQGSVDEMRSLVTRRSIRCSSDVAVDEVKSWPGVVEAVRNANAVQITAYDAEGVVRRLLEADRDLRNLEVKQATLAEAFTELTKEAA